MPIYEKVCASCRGKAIRTRIEKQNTDKTESDISKRIAEGVHLLESAGDSETDPYQSEELNGEEGSWYSPTYSQAICSECGKPFTSRRVVSRRYRGVYKKVCDTCRDKRIVE